VRDRGLKVPSEVEKGQIRTHARLLAVLRLGHDDPRVDALAAQLVHYALRYGLPVDDGPK